MLNSGYKEQFERLWRWLEKIRDHDIDTIKHLDFMWAYFQNCWHLKDWIVNDITVPEKIKGPKNKKGKYDEFEDKLKKYKNIMICADLANRSKHLILTKPKIENAQVSRIGVTVIVGNELLGGTKPTTTVQHYHVTGKSGELGDGVASEGALCAPFKDYNPHHPSFNLSASLSGSPAASIFSEVEWIS